MEIKMANIIDLGPVMLVPKGVWDAQITYERLNVVRHGSAAWICKVETSTGVEPSEDSSDWLILVKDISSVTSVNGQRGDVVIELTETTTPPADDNSNRVATTEWVTDKIEALDTDTISTDVEALKKSMLNVEGTANTAVSTANTKVSKAGDTMTGALYSELSGTSRSPLQINCKETNVTTAPSEHIFRTINAADAANYTYGTVGFQHHTNGETRTYIRARRKRADGTEFESMLVVHADASSTGACYATVNGQRVTTFTADNKLQFPNGTQIWVA
jgi:hypothetical protein